MAHAKIRVEDAKVSLQKIFDKFERYKKLFPEIFLIEDGDVLNPTMYPLRDKIYGELGSKKDYISVDRSQVALCRNCGSEKVRFESYYVECVYCHQRITSYPLISCLYLLDSRLKLFISIIRFRR